MTIHDRAYLTIAAWPGTLDEPRRAEALEAAGLDAAGARLAARIPAPMICHFVSAAERVSALYQLARRGVAALAPTRAELDALPAPVAAKRMTEAMGSDGTLYLVEPRHGDPQGLRTLDIKLLIRARIENSETLIQANPNAVNDAGRGYLIGGVPAVIARRMADGEGAVQRTTTSRTTDILDIYTTDQRRIRVIADKFDFELLGADRSYTGQRNLDALTLRLLEKAPQAAMDEGFDRFRPPADIHARAHQSGSTGAVRARSDLPAFDFYSPWLALTHDAIQAGPSIP
ncbi:MAG: hypothetical protein IPJ41_09965 [Phycisphaerales bacterium]|nr:hypothetical protein [Phycisphaerales bacterium]